MLSGEQHITTHGNGGRRPKRLKGLVSPVGIEPTTL